MRRRRTTWRRWSTGARRPHSTWVRARARACVCVCVCVRCGLCASVCVCMCTVWVAGWLRHIAPVLKHTRESPHPPCIERDGFGASEPHLTRHVHGHMHPPLLPASLACFALVWSATHDPPPPLQFPKEHYDCRRAELSTLDKDGVVALLRRRSTAAVGGRGASAYRGVTRHNLAVRRPGGGRKGALGAGGRGGGGVSAPREPCQHRSHLVVHA